MFVIVTATEDDGEGETDGCWSVGRHKLSEVQATGACSAIPLRDGQKRKINRKRTGRGERRRKPFLGGEKRGSGMESASGTLEKRWEREERSRTFSL